MVASNPDHGVKEEIVWPSAKSSVVAHEESAEASWDVP